MSDRNPLQDWVRIRYHLLKNEFGDEYFSIFDAVDVLIDDTIETARVVISELNRAGMVEKDRDPADRRRVLYKLGPEPEPEGVMRGMTTFQIAPSGVRDIYQEYTAGEVDEEDEFSVLERDLSFQAFFWDVVGAFDIQSEEDFKAFSMILLFKKIQCVLERHGRKVDLTLDDFIYGNVSGLEKLIRAGIGCGLSSRLRETIDSSALLDFTMYMNRRLSESLTYSVKKESHYLRENLVAFLNSFLFSHHEEFDRFFHEYMLFILNQNIYSKIRYSRIRAPPEAIEMALRLLDPKPGETFYDPAAYWGDILLMALQHMRSMDEGDTVKTAIYGQAFAQSSDEKAQQDALLMMSTIQTLFELPYEEFQFCAGDTLLSPGFLDGTGEHVRTFDVILGVPPWKLKGYGKKELTEGNLWEERYRCGFTSSRNSDWAFIQHMLASAGSRGRVGVFIDNEALTRGGPDGAIREQILQEELLDCVILMPENLFNRSKYCNRSSQGVFLLFKTSDSQNQTDVLEDSDEYSVLFIDASDGGAEDSTEDEIFNTYGSSIFRDIVDTYEGTNVDTLPSRRVPFEELQSHGFDLSLSLYITPPEKCEPRIVLVPLQTLIKEIFFVGHLSPEPQQDVPQELAPFIRDEAIAFHSENEIRKNDIVVSLRGEFKPVKYESKKNENAGFGSLFLRLDEEKIDPDFFLLFSELELLGQEETHAVSSSVVEDLIDVCVPLPSLKEQKKIVKAFSACPALLAMFKHKIPEPEEFFASCDYS